MGSESFHSRGWVILSLLSFSPLGAGAFELFELSRPFVRSYGVAQGLPHSTVQTILFGEDGRLWIGTQDGLVAYDGKSFEEIELASRDRSRFVRALAQGADGDLWIGTQASGLLRLSRQGAWTLFLTAGNDRAPRDSRINALAFERTSEPPRLWVGTHREGLWSFDGESWSSWGEEHGLPSRRIWDLLPTLLPDGSQKLWVATEAGPAWMEFPSQRIVRPPGAPTTSASSLALRKLGDGSEEVWVGLYGEGLAGWHQGSWRRIGPNEGLASRFVTDLATVRDRTDLLWVATDGGGAARFDGLRVRPLDLGPRLQSEGIYSLLETRDVEGARALWLGTRNTGLLRVVESEWRVISPKLEPSDASTPALLLREEAPQGAELWLGTDGFGLRRFRQGRWDSIRQSPQALESETVLALLESRKVGGSRRVWVGTRNGGLSEWDGRLWRVHSRATGALPNDLVQALLETFGTAGNATLWVGTREGLTSFDGTRWTIHDPEDGYPGGSILSLLAARSPRGEQEVWIGSSSGLYLIRGNQVVSRWEEEPLALSGIHALWMEDSPTGRQLWIGTDGSGAYLLDPDHSGSVPRPIESLGWPTLPNLAIQGIVGDRKGRIYLSTYRGVARLSWKADGSPGSLDWMNFEHGLPDSQTHRGAIARDRSGRIWVGTVAGACVFDPETGFLGGESPPMELRAYRVGHEGRLELLRDGAELPRAKARLLLRFRLVNFFGESLTQYRTELVGADEAGAAAWSSHAHREFGPLAPGKYRFRVWARDAWGRVTGPAEVGWEVEPAFWESPAGRSVQALAAAAVVGCLFGLRQRELKRRQRHLESEVARRTQELEKANHKLAEISYLDSLTAIPNRRRFEERLDEEWKRALRNRTPLSLLMLDIDGFKAFNDSCGHLAADDALRRVAQALAAEVARVTDFVARYGGEEFAILLPATEIRGAAHVAEGIRQRILTLQIAHPAVPEPGWLTVSCGVACTIPAPEMNPTLLVKAADRALYQAKRAGKNRIAVASELPGEPSTHESGTD